jgi:hypothetical protein
MDSEAFQAACCSGLALRPWGPLRVRCGAEDGALVVLQNFQPACDIACMVVANLWVMRRSA